MDQIIIEVIAAVGGKENIVTCSNCMTRLRLVLKNECNANRAHIKSLKGVFGIIEADGQFQIVLGPGKAAQAAETLNKLVA